LASRVFERATTSWWVKTVPPGGEKIIIAVQFVEMRPLNECNGGAPIKVRAVSGFNFRVLVSSSVNVMPSKG
jgi:hypothetical protein